MEIPYFKGSDVDSSGTDLYLMGMDYKVAHKRKRTIK